ncbi:flagellar type III secretion system protein FliR [Hyphobacterium sp. CCMP332]|jgi:flagellar biosynthesis protein FliR|uniref:flagellar biosynthetic protein FliR n=1 Tax=Hyphobacterium sp. CCMP332 TaxID=2749086 RepID=UPI001650C9E0|nr:flagellar biosynthetic protein FliR [Hyphobacterium sp. CCMP332]QNL18387.1 flagellar type III secretion system protein FliR [Hyphobacterium sp. CCMP332]
MIGDPSLLVFAGALIFARLGAILMLLPGFGEGSIPPRIRLAFALLFALALGPMLAGQMPAEPERPLQIAGLIINEVLIGLMIGAVARLFLASAAVAGQVIGQQTGLAMAQVFDPSQGQQGALMATFLNLTFMLLLFATNLHHLLLQAAQGSYMLFPVGEPPMIADAAQWALNAFIDAFTIGVQIASPLIVFGLVFYFGLGILSRLMPQAQIFFIAMPVNIMAGLFITAIALGSMATLWLGRMESFAVEFQ